MESFKETAGDKNNAVKHRLEPTTLDHDWRTIFSGNLVVFVFLVLIKTQQQQKVPETTNNENLWNWLSFWFK